MVSSQPPLKKPLWKFYPLTSIVISLTKLGNEGGWEMQSLLVYCHRKKISVIVIRRGRVLNLQVAVSATYCKL